MTLTDHQKSVIDTCDTEIRGRIGGRPSMSYSDAAALIVAAQLVDLNASLESVSFKLGELIDILNNR